MLAFASSATDEFEAALTEASKGIPIEPQTSSFGDPITTDFKELLRKLPPEKKEKLAAQITPLLPRLAQEESDPSIRNAFGPRDGILILKVIGTDEQKAQAFRNLDIYGSSRSEACRALATCEGNEGVKILKEYAESQFDNLAKNAPTPPESQPAEKPDVNIYHAVIALAEAYHPDGPVAAEKMRDRLLELAKLRLDATQLADVEKDFAKNMEKARHRRENLIREKRPNNKREANEGSTSMETSGKVSENASHPIMAKKWFWPGISITAILLVLACRVFIRRKAEKSSR
jgi:hypothetical protein